MASAEIIKLEVLGNLGLCISICYGPSPKGNTYSVDCLHPETYESFTTPFAARDFAHCLEIVELEAKERGWIPRMSAHCG